MRAGWRTRLAATGAVLLAAVGSALGDGKAAATVNGEPIPMAEVEAVLALRPPELFPIPQAQQRLIRHEVLEVLIGERLLKQFLVKNAPLIDKGELDKQMTVLGESLKAQGKTLTDFCKESRQTEAQIRAGIVNLLQFNAYARRLTGEAELKRYFEENLDYFQGASLRLSHIVIRIPAGSPPSERAEARKRLSAIRSDIVSGKVSFADAARQFSQCPSAAKGGDIGMVSRKWMLDETVAKTAFALKRDEVSDAVDSEFGVHLLKVAERTEGKKVEFAAVVDDVRDNYLEEMRQKLLLDLRRGARVEIHLK